MRIDFGELSNQRSHMKGPDPANLQDNDNSIYKISCEKWLPKCRVHVRRKPETRVVDHKSFGQAFKVGYPSKA